MTSFLIIIAALLVAEKTGFLQTITAALGGKTTVATKAAARTRGRSAIRGVQHLDNPTAPMGGPFYSPGGRGRPVGYSLPARGAAGSSSAGASSGSGGNLHHNKSTGIHL